MLLLKPASAFPRAPLNEFRLYLGLIPSSLHLRKVFLLISAGFGPDPDGVCSPLSLCRVVLGWHAGHLLGTALCVVRRKYKQLREDSDDAEMQRSITLWEHVSRKDA